MGGREGGVGWTRWGRKGRAADGGREGLFLIALRRLRIWLDALLRYAASLDLVPQSCGGGRAASVGPGAAWRPRPPIPTYTQTHTHTPSTDGINASEARTWCRGKSRRRNEFLQDASVKFQEVQK